MHRHPKSSLLFLMAPWSFFLTLFEAYNETFESIEAVLFEDRPLEVFGWEINFLAESNFTSVPLSDDVVAFIRTANYMFYIIFENVLTAGDYFVDVQELDLIAQAGLLDDRFDLNDSMTNDTFAPTSYPDALAESIPAEDDATPAQTA
jgi:hypothetical protein